MKKIKKYNQIIKEDRVGFDDIDDAYEENAPTNDDKYAPLPENEDGFYYGADEEDEYLPWEGEELPKNKMEDYYSSASKGLKDDERKALELENGKDRYPTEDDEDDDDEDDDEFDEYEEEGDISKDRKEFSFDDDDRDAMDHLASTIRNMISNLGISEFYVNSEAFDLSVQFILNKTERFTKVMKIMGLLRKLQTDILIQYDSEVDLWETKEGEPMLTIDFYYNPSTKGTYDFEELVF